LAPSASKWCNPTPILAPCSSLCTGATCAQEHNRLSLRHIESSRTQGNGLRPRDVVSSLDMCACPPAALTVKRRAPAIEASMSLHAPCTLVTQQLAGRHDASGQLLGSNGEQWGNLILFLTPCPSLCIEATGAQEHSRLSQRHIEILVCTRLWPEILAAGSSSVIRVCLPATLAIERLARASDASTSLHAPSWDNCLAPVASNLGSLSLSLHLVPVCAHKQPALRSVAV
jgi:hypothetical protein